MASWSDTGPHPWRRLLARLLDTAVSGSITFFAIGVLLSIVAPEDAVRFLASLGGSRIVEAVLTCVVAVPLNAVLVGWTGGSLGKWLFGVRVLDGRRVPIGLSPAVEREIWVLFEGLGMGIPFVAPITGYYAFRTLRDTGVTNWDAERSLVVVHREPGIRQVIGSTVGGVLLLCLLASLALLTLRTTWDT